MSADQNTVHLLWNKVTDNGRHDATVAEVEALFERLRDDLRARYTIEVNGALAEARIQAVHLAKVRVLGMLRFPRKEAP